LDDLDRVREYLREHPNAPATAVAKGCRLRKARALELVRRVRQEPVPQYALAARTHRAYVTRLTGEETEEVERIREELRDCLDVGGTYSEFRNRYACCHRQIRPATWTTNGSKRGCQESSSNARNSSAIRSRWRSSLGWRTRE